MPTPTPFDCYIEIRAEIWENPIPASTGESADRYDERYRGIYNVIVNRVITIVFCPKIGQVDVDQIVRSGTIVTEEEARYLTVTQADYAVLPDPIMAGQEAVLPNPLFPEDRMVLFYVSEQDFSRFLQEFGLGPMALHITDEDLAEENYARFLQELDIGPLTELTFLKYIVETIFASPNFSARDLHTLSHPDLK